MGFVVYLVSAELFEVGAICLWCTGVHVIMFVIFCLTALAAAGRGPPPGRGMADTG